MTFDRLALMQPDITQRLDALRRDFADVVGRPFVHFFCPILFVDEETELCRAHVVNRAFVQSSRRWTLQRKDVDNFFGAMFEAEFVDLRYNETGVAVKALLEPDLYRRMRPRVLLDGVPVEHFVANGALPKQFAELRVEHNEGQVTLGLKMSLERLAAVNKESDWQFEVSRDVRVPAVVSVLKAAHLSMFELLGYGYALAPNGVWFGRVLGSFYVENAGNPKPDVLLKAAAHFSPVAAMVRPVKSAPSAITGTVDDGWFHFCWSKAADRVPWGVVTYVRTGDTLHAVLVPTMGDEAATVRFAQFLRGRGDAFEISIARFEGTRWTVEQTRRGIEWPPDSLSG